MYYTLTPKEQESLEKLVQEFDIEKQNTVLNSIHTQRQLKELLEETLCTQIVKIEELQFEKWGLSIELICKLGINIPRGILTFIASKAYLQVRLTYDIRLKIFTGKLEVHFEPLSGYGAFMTLVSPKDKSDLHLVYNWKENRWEILSQKGALSKLVGRSID
jgi:hypothetical protein